MHWCDRVGATKSEDLFVLLHLFPRDFTPDNLKKQPNMITHMQNPWTTPGHFIRGVNSSQATPKTQSDT